MKYKSLLVAGLLTASFLAQSLISAGRQSEDDNRKRDGSTPSVHQFSENDVYLDLNTGKSFRVIYDHLNDLYNRDDLFGFDLYVNTRTQDTMWQERALVVNNALLRDAQGRYRIDPMKVKRDGDGYRVVTGR